MAKVERNLAGFVIFAILATLILPILAKEPDCMNTNYNLEDKPCPTGYNEMYKDVHKNGRHSVRYCCKPGTDLGKKTKGNGNSCRATECLSSKTPQPCSTLPARYIDDKRLVYEEVMRDPCTKPGGRGKGSVVMCCQPDSDEGMLVSTFGAEQNEFPHQAKLKLPGHCGGTVYNSQWIITAAHCIVDNGKVGDVSEMKVVLGTNIADADTEDYVYNVTSAIPHEGYSKLATNDEFAKGAMARTFNDIALLKLGREITFTDKIKALEIVPPNFDPFAHADKAVIIGWGTTDTLAVAQHLQKANFVLRDDYKCLDHDYGRYHGWNYTVWQDSLLCVGGVMDGKWSYISGTGDSGGPAICRNKDGNPLLCGVTSFGGSQYKCQASSVEANCPPSVYTEVANFTKWIEGIAGYQDRNSFYRPYLYGKEVPWGQYEHQVHITSVNGKPCGGTLIAKNIVVTTASCVSRSDDTSKRYTRLQVTASTGETFKVKGIKNLPGFRMDGKPVSESDQGDRIRITDNYHANDLAVIKLDGGVSMSPGKKFPALPVYGDKFGGGKELAFSREASKSGKLISREFRLLDRFDCQTRMNRMAKVNVTANIDESILCGVEKYSGGSTCDRELGGGLICKGKGGEDVLCGVQMFRLCEFSFPNGFRNVAFNSYWVTQKMNELLRE